MSERASVPLIERILWDCGSVGFIDFFAFKWFTKAIHIARSIILVIVQRLPN